MPQDDFAARAADAIAGDVLDFAIEQGRPLTRAAIAAASRLAEKAIDTGVFNPKPGTPAFTKFMDEHNIIDMEPLSLSGSKPLAIAPATPRKRTDMSQRQLDLEHIKFSGLKPNLSRRRKRKSKYKRKPRYSRYSKYKRGSFKRRKRRRRYVRF